MGPSLGVYGGDPGVPGHGPLGRIRRTGSMPSSGGPHHAAGSAPMLQGHESAVIRKRRRPVLDRARNIRQIVVRGSRTDPPTVSGAKGRRRPTYLQGPDPAHRGPRPGWNPLQPPRRPQHPRPDGDAVGAHSRGSRADDRRYSGMAWPESYHLTAAVLRARQGWIFGPGVDAHNEQFPALIALQGHLRRAPLNQPRYGRHYAAVPAPLRPAARTAQLVSPHSAG